jgi:hypothetical protein
MPKSPIAPVRAILGSGALIGLMDGAAASVFALARGGTPAGVFRYVASGVFGKSSLTGGSQMVAWGVLFHLIVATGWTALYFLIAPKVRFLTTHWLVAGMSYGLLVWLAMNFLVVPMSNASPAPVRLTAGTAIMILIHLFVIGVPIALLAKRFRAT